MSKSVGETSRPKQFLIGGIGVLFVALVIGVTWRLAFLDGFIGEFFALIAGVFSTPIFLELSLVVLGLIVVITINAIRLKREGDEFVYLEEVAGPDESTLPAAARKVIYREKPEFRVELGALALAEGAFELDDYDEAWSYLEKLSPDDFDSEDGLVLRLKLAKATGKVESASGALEQLRSLNSEHPFLKEWTS